ncbi:hypothetical protein BV25DRAFT_1828248, partial [Artomyces pyxidatus]
MYWHERTMAWVRTIANEVTSKMILAIICGASARCEAAVQGQLGEPVGAGVGKGGGLWWAVKTTRKGRVLEKLGAI